MTRRWFRLALAAVLPTVALSGGTAFAAPDQSAGVSVVVTDLGAQKYLAPQPGMSWQRGSAPAGPTITVDTTRRYQEITGFGASFTDSSAWLIGTKLDASQRDAVMRDLFSDQGIGLSFLRQPMGASDFAVKGNYSYDDMPPGKTDPTLAHFSIDHDRAYIIPLLLQARRINPHLTVMATPWSPPGWMKTSDSMIGGTLRPEAYQPLADYFAKFIEDYAAAGVPIRYITPQNEPLFIPGGYPGMFLSATQADDLIKNHLGPTLGAHHLPTGILAYDHNWDAISYPETMYADPDAAGYVAGTAWHCYGGDVITQAVSHNNYPNKPAFHTECSGGEWEGDAQAGFAAALGLVIDTTRTWAKGTIRWNMALDENNGPTNGGCETCRGVVTVTKGANGKWTYAKTVDYWGLGQVSKYVHPGARRVASNSFGNGDVKDVAFVNPDGGNVLVAFNTGTSPRTFAVQWGNRWLRYTLAGGAAATFTWTGTPQGNIDPAAIGSVDVPFTNPDGSQALITFDASMLAGVAQARVGNQWLGYTLPTGASLSPGTTEVQLPRTGWTVSASASSPDDPVGNAIDGNPATRWSSGHGQQPGDWFQVDLGSRQTFDRIVLDTTGSPGDGVVRYEVQTSDDGTTWSAPIATGPGSTVTTIQVPPATGRFIRVTDQGSSGSWWSIHELTVQAPGEPAPAAGQSGDVQRRTAQLPDGTQLNVVYNSGKQLATFDVVWGSATYTYRLPVGAAAIFTTRSAA
jgi:glucosylceramidase